MTRIRLTNSATRRKEDFTPLDPDNVRMYVCGPTVYDRAHLGNARPAIVFDVLYRLLRHTYGADHVTYVRNITDVDDKINARAAETGRSIGDITAETTRWYFDDMAAIGNLRPTHTPRATEYIAQMIAMIADLIGKGHAYEAEGHALFRVRSYESYGALSGRSVDDMRAGARVEVAPYKEDPMDFVLWKPSDDGQPGWDSPWGYGRPGWHIECSAMAAELLGTRFDIHGGGNDLMFPHHENEIAQSACAHGGTQMAQVWLHNEMLQVEGKKMSKSLGNFFTVRDLLDQGVPGEVIRFVMLSTHYRKPMDWMEEKVREAEKTLRYWENMCTGYPVGEVPEDFLSLVSDDLNTYAARQLISELVGAKEYPAAIACAKLLGFEDLGTIRKPSKANLIEKIDYLFRMWTALRNAKRYESADLIRSFLQISGFTESRDGERLTWRYDDSGEPFGWHHLSSLMKVQNSNLSLASIKNLGERRGINVWEFEYMSSSPLMGSVTAKQSEYFINYAYKRIKKLIA